MLGEPRQDTSTERDDTPRLLTVREVAAVYFQGKVSEREVYALFASGAIRGFRVGSGRGRILIYESSLNAYRMARENAAPQQVAAPPLPRPAPGRGRDVPAIRLSRLPD